MTTTLLERRMIELTPDLAKHYLTFNTYEYQRAVRSGHVNVLVDKINDGRFRFGDIAMAEKSRKTIMLNGQHICNAVISSNKEVPCMLEKFKCENSQDISMLFRQFEMLPRSLGDMVNAEAGSLGLTWPRRFASLIVAAAVLEKYPSKSFSSPRSLGSTWQNRSTQADKDSKVQLLKNYIKEGDFAYKILSWDARNSKSRHLQRAAIVYVIMKTMRIDQEFAKRFWSKVRDGEFLSKDRPEFKLREFLISAVRNLGASKPRLSNHEYVYRCSLAWNAARRNKNTSLAYRSDKIAPELI